MAGATAGHCASSSSAAAVPPGTRHSVSTAIPRSVRMGFPVLPLDRRVRGSAACVPGRRRHSASSIPRGVFRDLAVGAPGGPPHTSDHLGVRSSAQSGRGHGAAPVVRQRKQRKRRRKNPAQRCLPESSRIAGSPRASSRHGFAAGDVYQCGERTGFGCPLPVAQRTSRSWVPQSTQ